MSCASVGLDSSPRFLIGLIAKCVVVVTCQPQPHFLLARTALPLLAMLLKEMFDVPFPLFLDGSLATFHRQHDKSCHDKNDSHKLRTTSLCRTNSMRPIKLPRDLQHESRHIADTELGVDLLRHIDELFECAVRISGVS